MIKRVIWIVLDSAGIGAMPDSDGYGDTGANTIGNVSKAVGGLTVENLVNLGLGNIDGIQGVNSIHEPFGCFGRFMEASAGKDTIVGHWEMSGIISNNPFPTYPNGFPQSIIESFETEVGRKVIGNKAASGTTIINELGTKHIESGAVIVYTSADSVFQIAAHEDVICIDELYSMCNIARKVLTGEHSVARVIARPFAGKPGTFERTAARRDFSLMPPYATALDNIKNAGLDVIGIGKIEDIFAGQGITLSMHTDSNMDGVDKTIKFIKEDNKGLIFTNLVDFDMKWGHRNDWKGYANGLEQFDSRLSEILNAMKDTDVLIITADHGCDPTLHGTDHTREYVPFIAYGQMLKNNINLGTRNTFADMGQTVCNMLNVKKVLNGTSFLNQIL